MVGKAVAWQAPVVLTFTGAANAAIADTHFFDAQDADYELLGVTEKHGTAGSDGGAVTLDVVKVASAGTIAGGTTLLASTFNLKSTVDVPVNKTLSNGGLATARIIKQGEGIALNYTGTLTALAGHAVTLFLRRLTRPEW